MDTLVKRLFPSEQVAMMATGVGKRALETDASGSGHGTNDVPLCPGKIGRQEAFRSLSTALMDPSLPSLARSHFVGQSLPAEKFLRSYLF